MSSRLRLISALRRLDTACLCDAEKFLVSQKTNNLKEYQPLLLMEELYPRGKGNGTIAGIARTVQCSEPNDFLAVLQGLQDSESDEILIVNTRTSKRAVAGELFCAEASRRGLPGIIIDGPMRDTNFLSNYPKVRCFSRSVTPYSGTTSHLGKLQVTVECGGVMVEPNSSIIVADDDGIIVGSLETFEQLEQLAREIQSAEERIRIAIADGKTIHEMTNFEAHVEAI
eukprot:CAMPEP_0194252676 /NCGR_PEP_ID=MMETSP0158-20130606/28147_1 /TAXON_ID=33649 /ORGANISM="Thalassionema nitzschioides, Strain L26-B" /LENGTH=226 /DNA_ID=CAMNT_0038990141 /DNA_START=82 /DNA_END=759 /DNA_ORIENTATION=+